VLSDRPIVAISMGDPAGIGPEICVSALMKPQVRTLCRPLVVGGVDFLRRAAKVLGVNASLRAIDHPSQATYDDHVIEVVNCVDRSAEAVPLGTVSAEGGDAAFLSVRHLIDLGLAGAVDATVTAPIHKQALLAAGHHFPGHTEIFARFAGGADVTMMLVVGKVRVVHVSTHVSLRNACDAVTRDRVLAVIRLAHDACRSLGIKEPKIGVAGLNPHASDGGLFGTEEEEQIIPACRAAQAMGMKVEGPFPADTFFPRVVAGAYDVAVAMYHDQGHVPAKLEGFRYDAAAGRWASVRGINVSLGVGVIRTSVDHGTAFDQAGTGQATDESLVDAIEYAAQLARARHR
jgi:4-phospho-D-threonate 3-dehydrogenase / 4-phospho-D-erythronate 3-dehydrogenase